MGKVRNKLEKKILTNKKIHTKKNNTYNHNKTYYNFAALKKAGYCGVLSGLLHLYASRFYWFCVLVIAFLILLHFRKFYCN